MVTLTTVNWMPEADFLCAQLASYGIEAHIPDQNTATVLPLHGGALGGIRILVDESDFEEARTILNDLNEVQKKQEHTCPACDSEKVTAKVMSWGFAAVVVVLFGIPLLWWRKEFTCTSCGHQWKHGQVTEDAVEEP